MFSLRDLILESEASAQAKQMGLVSAGFGRYKDPKTNKVTHKSKEGKLVALAKPVSANPQKASEPSNPVSTSPKSNGPKDPSSLGSPADYESAPRPKRMKAIDPSSVVGRTDDPAGYRDKPVDYGDCHSLFVDKYGKENGDVAYEKLFASANNNFGWSIAGKITKEKRAMIAALGYKQPKDLHNVAYYPLWKEWQKKEGISQVSDEQPVATPQTPASSPEKKPRAKRAADPNRQAAIDKAMADLEKPEKKTEIPKEASEIFTNEKLSDFMKLGNRISSLTSELEKLNKEYGEQTASMLDEFDRTNQKQVETEQFIAKMARRQSLRTTQSYQQGFQFLLDKVNAELKKAAEEALKATEKISYVRGKVDVRRKEPVAEENNSGQVQSISDAAAANIKKSNDNIESLLMLMQMLGKEPK